MNQDVFQRRIIIGAGLCVLAFALVGIRLVHVSLFAAPGDGTVAARAVLARADLIDRNGELLARDLPVKDLYARPDALFDLAAAARDLSAATGADQKRLITGFHAKLHSKRPYVLVARRLTPDQEAAVMHLGLPGLEFEPSARRYYPDGRNAAQLVGVTDPDNNGVSGLELGLQDRIHQAASTGAVATSIDMRVQYILTHEVAAARKTFSARAAGGIVMDVNSGEVLGLVSLPDFDPNARRLADGDSATNIMAQDVYELGSVFKIFSFALGFEDRTMRLEEMFKIGQGLKIGKYTIHEAERMPEALPARDILAQSSNIGTAQIALRSGGRRQRAFLANLGLLAPLRSELPETARPLYPSNWGAIETATVGFGQGISVSPLSFVAAAATVVNGGRRITPTFIKQDGVDRRGEQVIKPETSAQMRDLLRYVVTDGTGKKADVVGYDVGGKTGSAQVPGEHGRYIPHALRTSFCAVFPVHNPRYIVFVILDQPHGTKETGGFALAGYTAAPMAGKVIQRIAPLLGVPNVPPPPTKLADGSS
jgi:cell division protein FtsI (penicillin-binding protein 3)